MVYWVANDAGIFNRRDGAYVGEILRAFGVSETEVKTTIYGNRQTTLETKPPPSRPRPVPTIGGSAHEGAWGAAWRRSLVWWSVPRPGCPTPALTMLRRYSMLGGTPSEVEKMVQEPTGAFLIPFLFLGQNIVESLQRISL